MHQQLLTHDRILVDFLNKSPETYIEQRRSQRGSLCSDKIGITTVEDELITYPNHIRAELLPAFRVSSQASSKAIGSIVMEQIPITAMIINKAAVLFGLTSQSNFFFNFLDFWSNKTHTSPDKGEPPHCNEWDQDFA